MTEEEQEEFVAERRMRAQAIQRAFERPTPRQVRLKEDSPEVGVEFNPFGGCAELCGCGGPIFGILLLIVLIPSMRPWSLMGVVVFVSAITGWMLLVMPTRLRDVIRHRRLARYGEVAVGQVTRITSTMESFGDFGSSPTVTVEYEFHTHSGLGLTSKRVTTPGYYRMLVQEWQAHTTKHRATPILIVYLPEDPAKHEPYDSLRYQIVE